MKTVPRVPLTIVLHNIRSAYNVGAVLRTADVAWIGAVVTSGVTPPADHPKVKKTALGSESVMRTPRYPTLRATVDALRADGHTVYAMEIGPASRSLWELPDADLAAPTALVFGNEVDGVPLDETRALALPELMLPQFGVKSSLNVATAAAITMYHIRYRLTAAGFLGAP
ncbi:MAG: TrmH family RNA methyltransferase [Chloroflexota bacterium]